MKKTLIACLVAAQILAVQPASAAPLHDDPAVARQGHGAFAGARLRVPLGGSAEPARAGLAIAPVQRGYGADGGSSLRFGEGVELGFAGEGKARLMLGGQPLGARLAAAQEEGEDEDGGISTLGTVAIVVGGLLVVGGIGLAVLAHEISKNSE